MLRGLLFFFPLPSFFLSSLFPSTGRCESYVAFVYPSDRCFCLLSLFSLLKNLLCFVLFFALTSLVVVFFLFYLSLLLLDLVRPGRCVGKNCCLSSVAFCSLFSGFFLLLFFFFFFCFLFFFCQVVSASRPCWNGKGRMETGKSI